ncbi:DUF6126 family protein [Streptomyces sp. NBC_01190]|uniref:DUF6126 family protein n=1 Tax=Streptomyces sp. NBC_01190 TaxID=2903767 RepID=UPI00386F8A54|nr:DUF6126 family protein [Streptomyces sp. NBC_01190]
MIIEETEETEGPTVQPAAPAAPPAPATSAGPGAPIAEGSSRGTEKLKQRGVVLRVLVYVVVAHLLGFYLWLMFAVLGKH